MDYVERRNLNQPSVVVAVDVVADSPTFKSVRIFWCIWNRENIWGKIKAFWAKNNGLIALDLKTLKSDCKKQWLPVCQLIPLCNRATIDRDSQLAILVLLLLQVREHLLDQLPKISGIIKWRFIWVEKCPTCLPRDCLFSWKPLSAYFLPQDCTLSWTCQTWQDKMQMWKLLQPVEGVPVRVHVQHVHGEVVGSQIHRRENFIHCHLIGAVHANLLSNLNKIIIGWRSPTFSLPSVLRDFLMNLSKCFWFMEEAAWMWVSTCITTKEHEFKIWCISVPLFTSRDAGAFENLPFARCRNPDEWPPSARPPPGSRWASCAAG